MSVDINDPPLGVSDQIMVPVQFTLKLSQHFLQLLWSGVRKTVKVSLNSLDPGSDNSSWLCPLTVQATPG